VASMMRPAFSVGSWAAMAVDFVAVDADIGEASVGGGYDGAVANYGVKTHLRSP